MRAYTVAAAALALDVEHKWLDNLLSHHDVPGIVRTQRGIRRRIPARSVSIIALARALQHALSVPLHRALEFATGVMETSSNEHPIAPFLSLHIDREKLVTGIARRLDEAAEVAAVPVRGRRPHPRNSSAP